MKIKGGNNGIDDGGYNIPTMAAVIMKLEKG